jgi:hypothetical protein
MHARHHLRPISVLGRLHIAPQLIFVYEIVLCPVCRTYEHSRRWPPPTIFRLTLACVQLTETTFAHHHCAQDVCVFWVGWGLCFFAYYLSAESFVVCAAGLSLGVFTYRQVETSAELNGTTYNGKTGNLASIPALTMCRTYVLSCNRPVTVFVVSKSARFSVGPA